MERASPAELRKSLELVEMFKMTGIMFVPVPVSTEEEKQELISRVFKSLEDAELEDSANEE